jgi:hypothetical protein
MLARRLRGWAISIVVPRILLSRCHATADDGPPQQVVQLAGRFMPAHTEPRAERAVDDGGVDRWTRLFCYQIWRAPLLAYVFVLAVALVAGCLSGVIGTGSSIMLLPVLVFAYGPKEAVPIMAVAAVMSNVSRVALWWRELN